MSDLITVSLNFPTAIFTVGLLVVVGYWLVALLGLVGVDVLDADGEPSGSTGAAMTVLPRTRASRGVPATVVLSLWVLVSWLLSAFGSWYGAALLELSWLGFAAKLGLLVAAPVVGWVVTLLLVVPAGRAYPGGDAASRHDFVGAVCEIRTRAVTVEYGQAELTSKDGSTAIIQVRRNPDDRSENELSAGDSALIYDYDPAAEVFYVSAFDLAHKNDG